MVEDDQIRSNSSSGGGGVFIGSIGHRSSKKQKQKKVPQRGLGVAQLEKIRLEEQQKKDQAAQVFSPQSTRSPTKPSYLSPPPPNYGPSNQSSSSIPFPHSPTDLSSPNFIFRPPPPIQNIDSRNWGVVSLANNVNSGGFEMGWHGSSVSGHVNIPKLWKSCDYNFEKENCGVDPGLGFRPNLSLPFECNPIWPLPGLVQRSQQYQQQSSSMMKVSSATSSSSSVLNIQMEPPSNQSYYGNYTPLWPEEEKVVGIKRPYPFSLDNPPGPSFDYKIPTIVYPNSRVDESSASCANGSASNFEPNNPIFREGPPYSTPIFESNSMKSIKANGVSNGDFLTLAPPATNLMCPSSKYKHSSAYIVVRGHEFAAFESLPYQGSIREQIVLPGSSGSNQQQQFYSFFPPAKAQIGHAAPAMNNCNGEVGESVDLNLKL